MSGKALAALGLALLAVLLAVAGPSRFARSDGGLRIDLLAPAKHTASTAAPFASRRLRGSTCATLAKELGVRLDSDFRRLPYNESDFESERVWRVEVGHLNRLFGRLTQLRLECDTGIFVAAVDRRLSPEFHANAFRFVTVPRAPWLAHSHAEWRAVLTVYLDEFARLQRGA